MNYNWNNVNHYVMCYTWIKQAKKYLTKKDVCFIFSRKKLPNFFLEKMHSSNTCQFKNCVTAGLEDNILFPQYFCPEKKYLDNIKFKLFITTNINFNYFFIDADAFIVGDLKEIEEIIEDKPVVFVDHETVPGYTDKLPYFLNSGCFLVNDPNKKIYNWEKIYDHGKKCGFSPSFKQTLEKIPGTDQAVLMSYFEKIGYDYHHEKFDTKYNTCATNVIFEYKKNLNEYKFKTKNNEVKIIHYWDPFKPWSVNCPIFEETLNDSILNEYKFFDKNRQYKKNYIKI